LKWIQSEHIHETSFLLPWYPAQREIGCIKTFCKKVMMR
jgi:hypothetical protein